MESPLVEHMPGLFVHPVGHCVLGDQAETVGGGQLIDAVVDLRVDVVRPAGHNQNFVAVGAGIVDDLLPLGPDLRLILGVGGIGRTGGADRLLFGMENSFSK